MTVLLCPFTRSPAGCGLLVVFPSRKFIMDPEAAAWTRFPREWRDEGRSSVAAPRGPRVQARFTRDASRVPSLCQLVAATRQEVTTHCMLNWRWTNSSVKQEFTPFWANWSSDLGASGASVLKCARLWLLKCGQCSWSLFVF